MAQSNDPVKDAFKSLFGLDKKEEEQKAQAEQAAAPAEQAPLPSLEYTPPAPAEQAPLPSLEYTPPVEQAAAPQDDRTTDFHQSMESQSAQPVASDVAAHEPAQAAPVPASNPDVEQINGHAVGYEFLRYYKEHPEIGQPVDAQHGNVGGYQMFENAILHWNGSSVRAESRGGQGQGNQGGGQRTYTVNSGDSLSAIAQQHYGDASQWQRIFNANRDKLSNPDLIHPGQELIIP
ncbi:MAG: peptidoglycan-binding protein LysM [Chloroflexi bacterium]|jgi:nucleoid-associated protein YgaU|nr:peptidoglycan-binding protein LysM [Chloroflexota bacterium]